MKKAQAIVGSFSFEFLFVPFVQSLNTNNLVQILLQLSRDLSFKLWHNSLLLNSTTTPSHFLRRFSVALRLSWCENATRSCSVIFYLPYLSYPLLQHPLPPLLPLILLVCKAFRYLHVLAWLFLVHPESASLYLACCLFRFSNAFADPWFITIKFFPYRLCSFPKAKWTGSSM